MLDSQPKKAPQNKRPPITESFYTNGRPGAASVSTSAGGDTGVGRKQISVGPKTPDEALSAGVGNGDEKALTPENFPNQPGLKKPEDEIAVFSNQPTDSDRIGELIKNGSLANHPAYQQILANRTKLTALKSMPTYTNKKGEVRQGMQDKDGRLQSGLKGLVAGLADAFGPGNAPVRNEGDLYARLAGGITRGVGGAIVPEWNEHQERQNEIQRLEQEEQTLAKQLEFDSKMQTQEVARQQNIKRGEIAEKRANIADKSLDAKITKDQFQQLNAEQKTLLSSILKRGFYKEGVNPEEDARLEKLGVILPDFDSRKPIVKKQNGKWFQYDHDKQDWGEADGMPVDESEVPLEWGIKNSTGQIVKMKLRPRDIATIESANVRQEDQQAFAADQNAQARAERREQWLKDFNYKVEQDAKKGTLDKLKMIKDANDAFNSIPPKMDKETYDRMMQTLNKY